MRKGLTVGLNLEKRSMDTYLTLCKQLCALTERSHYHEDDFWWLKDGEEPEEPEVSLDLYE